MNQFAFEVFDGWEFLNRIKERYTWKKGDCKVRIEKIKSSWLMETRIRDTLADSARLGDKQSAFRCAKRKVEELEQTDLSSPS